MYRRYRFLILSWTFISTTVVGQKLKKADKEIVANLQAHVTYLANDKLEGRRAGTTGEKLSADYISAQFQKSGLQPRGDNNTWLQAFEIYDGKQINAATYLIINGNDLKLNDEFFPLTFSPNKTAEAAVAMALAESGVPWFYDIKETLEENKDNPHFDLQEAIKTKAAKVAAKGATALLLYNSSDIQDNLKFNGKDKVVPSAIPVLYITPSATKKYLSDPSATLDMKLKVEIGDKKRTGHNVVAYIDNGALTTVVLGAHYDHLGYGEDGNSMIRSDSNRQIHNGADDNASGTAALLELARLLKQSKSKKNNYLFIAFSGEELGLNGSKYFTEHPAVDITSINYMINMDMVGRLNESKILTVGGYGTSPLWGTVLNSVSDKKYFNIKFDSSGTGPSDHASFYRKDIPVLFFFTGLHTDYHKPTDDYDKINYVGELQIIKYIAGIIETTNTKGKLAFNKTRETQMASTTRFSVTLGIMPDYTFSGNGIRVDGVSEDRPAKKAGMQTGDIIIQLGDHPITSIEGYMQALSKFKKGDKTKVKFNRNTETLEAEVQF